MVRNRSCRPFDTCCTSREELYIPGPYPLHHDYDHGCCFEEWEPLSRVEEILASKRNRVLEGADRIEELRAQVRQLNREAEWERLENRLGRRSLLRTACKPVPVQVVNPSCFCSNYDGDTTTTYSCANPDANSVKLQSENLHHHVIHSPKRERTEVLLGSILRELSEKKSNWEKLREESKIRKIAESVAKKARVQTEQSERKRAASTKKTQLINEKMFDVFSYISNYL